MVRMIDADALQELCNRRIQDTWNSGTAPVSWAEAYADFKDDIDSIPTLTPPNEPRAGLYGEYTVYKNKDGSLVTDCFILRPAKDPAAVAALRAYAAATDNAELSADIVNWVGAGPNEPLPVLVNDEPDREYIDYICPRCKDIISQRRRGQRMETVYQCKYHDNCGQCVDWTNPQPYRRPPERQEGEA